MRGTFLTVITRLVLNRSSECSEEAVKELDEAPIVYCLRSALNKQKAFAGPSTGSGRTECWIFPFTGCWNFPFVVSLSNHRPTPERDAIYATNFRVGTTESRLAMTSPLTVIARRPSQKDDEAIWEAMRLLRFARNDGGEGAMRVPRPDKSGLAMTGRSIT